MSDIYLNALRYMQKRWPSAVISHSAITATFNDGTTTDIGWRLMAIEPNSGIKHRCIAIPDIGLNDHYAEIPKTFEPLFQEADSQVFIGFGNSIKKSSSDINNNQMTFAPRLILYTNKLHISAGQVIELYDSCNVKVDLVNEQEMYKSAFISYGGPDQDKAQILREKLTSRGIKTFYFDQDAKPGAKLHREMHDGVNEHDKVLLLCSQHSLGRPGVLNEIERVLEREANEGGSDVLIPVTIDDFVYKEWAPSRPDIAKQVRNRVITKVDFRPHKRSELDQQIEKIINALRITN